MRKIKGTLQCGGVRHVSVLGAGSYANTYTATNPHGHASTASAYAPAPV